MRALKTEIAGLPAGTLFEIYESFGSVRARWIGPDKLTRGRRIDGGRMPPPFDVLDIEPKDDSSFETALALYAGHIAALGCDPETLVPCGFCGEEIAACLTLCTECKRDPAADVPCEECQDHTGRPTGLWEYSNGEGLACHVETCRACRGELKVEPPYAGEREAALKAARGLAAGGRP